MKKLILVIMWAIPTITMAVSGFIPQGKKLPNGQMDPTTMVSVSRQSFVDFVNTGKIPLNVTYVYNIQWKTSESVRKQYAQLLRTTVEQKTGIAWNDLAVMILDQDQTPIIALESDDQVVSNGVGYVHGKLSAVPAPKRSARTLSDGSLESYLVLPNNVFVYMTCLNIDISSEQTQYGSGEEGNIYGNKITTGDTVFCIIRDTLINNHKIVQPSQPIVVHDTVRQNKVIVYQKETQVINNYHYVSEQPQVIRKTVTMYYNDPDCTYCPKPGKGTITNICPQGTLNGKPAGTLNGAPQGTLNYR